MKRVCAWCNGGLEDADRLENREVTHGLCQECRLRYFSSAKGKEADPRSAILNEGRKGAERPRKPTKP